jgi:hypothetical protein
VQKNRAFGSCYRKAVGAWNLVVGFAIPALLFNLRLFEADHSS